MIKQILKYICLFTFVAAMMLALTSPVLAQTPGKEDSPIIFGSDFVLAKGQTIEDLVVFGGNVVLENGSIVTGDVVVFGGNVTISGEVRGDVTDFGGNVLVNESGFIGGDLSTLGGNSQLVPGGTVQGKRITGIGNLPLGIPTKIYARSFWVDLGKSAGILTAIFTSLILALLAVLVDLFLPTPTSRVARTIGTQPVISGAVGLLTLIVTPALFLVLIVTIILIPLGLIGLLIFAIAIVYGWIATGLELGKRLAALLNASWPDAVSAGTGTLLLALFSTLTLFLTGQWFWTLCCLGLPLAFVLTMVGLGGVVSSKFGAQVYNPNRPITPQAASMPVPPTPPVPPDQPAQPLTPMTPSEEPAMQPYPTDQMSPPPQPPLSPPEDHPQPPAAP